MRGGAHFGSRGSAAVIAEASGGEQNDFVPGGTYFGGGSGIEATVVEDASGGEESDFRRASRRAVCSRRGSSFRNFSYLAQDRHFQRASAWRYSLVVAAAGDRLWGRASSARPSPMLEQAEDSGGEGGGVRGSIMQLPYGMPVRLVTLAATALQNTITESSPPAGHHAPHKVGVRHEPDTG